MPHYTLTDNQKTLVRLMAQGIQDGSVNASWTVDTSDAGRTVLLWGANEFLQQEFRSRRFRVSDLDLLVEYGLMFRNGKAYCLKEQMIIDAVNSDFKDELEVDLEPEQEALLSTLVEAHRNVPPSKRTAFYAASSRGGQRITHPGLPNGEITANLVDLKTLLHHDLLFIVREAQYSRTVSISGTGFRYYEQLRRRAGNPVRQVETHIQNYLNVERFWKSYPLAYRKWSEAADLVWRSDSEEKLTSIGHLCREAAQEFITTLVERFQPPTAKPDKASTVQRFKAVKELVSSQLGITEQPFLEALLTYLGELLDLIQRQEHGGQKEGSPLVWEDARRVVFQTAVVFFEIDSSFSRIGAPR